MRQSHAHRSYVSYMDKSREYYHAHGYPQPYQWAHHDTVPFCRLQAPVSELRIGVVTTADKGKRDAPRDKKLFAAPTEEAHTLFTEKSWDKEATHTDDPETYLPITCLQQFAAEGRIGSLSPRFYGAATDYSQRRTTEEDAPQIEAWMREDGVEAALLIAL